MLSSTHFSNVLSSLRERGSATKLKRAGSPGYATETAWMAVSSPAMTIGQSRSASEAHGDLECRSNAHRTAIPLGKQRPMA